MKSLEEKLKGLIETLEREIKKCMKHLGEDHICCRKCLQRNSEIYAYNKALTLAKKSKEEIVTEMRKHRKGTYARNKREISCVWLMDADIIIEKHLGKFEVKE